MKGRYGVLTKVKKARRVAKHFQTECEAEGASERPPLQVAGIAGTQESSTLQRTPEDPIFLQKGKEGALLCGTVTLPSSAATM